MFSTPIVAGIAFYVFYAVAFTKFLFDGIGKPGTDKQGKPTPGNPSLQNGVVRLWALVLGVAGAVVDAHFGGNLSTGTPLYEAVKNGVIGTIFAVLTYHVGNSQFINPLDGGTSADNAGVTTLQITQPAPIEQPPRITQVTTPAILPAVGGNAGTALGQPGPHPTDINGVPLHEPPPAA